MNDVSIQMQPLLMLQVGKELGKSEKIQYLE